MPALLFRNAESAFVSWINSNPDGYVVNAMANFSQRYFVLHRATCTTLHREVPTGGYTERNQVKACTSDATPAPLLAWILQVRGSGFTKVCSVCKPTAPLPLQPQETEAQQSLESQVAEARKLSPTERAKLIPSSDSPPTFYPTTSIAFVRNPFVAAEVLERANGLCEGCGSLAPFVRASDGTPYLEVHHKVRLADGGHDSVENAVALCPNCHRRRHFGASDG